MLSRAWLLLLALAACKASIPEGKLACAGVSDCPPDWMCLLNTHGEDRCYSSEAARAADQGSSGRPGGESGRDGEDGGDVSGAGGMSGRGDGGAATNGGASGSGNGGDSGNGEAGEGGSSGSSAGSGAGSGGAGSGGAAGEVIDPDTNECETGVTETCGAGAIDCDEVGPSYTCTCGLGYDGTDTTACTDADECSSTNVCTPDFPCINQSPFYTCQGRFADWPPEDTPSPSPFTVNGSGADATVTDSRSGLVWQQTASSSTFTWEEAKQHCMDDLDGDWRLPTRAELESIVDYGRATRSINTTAFPSTAGGFFWTSSPYAPDDLSAWSIDFRYGNCYGQYFTETQYVRCVR